MTEIRRISINSFIFALFIIANILCTIINVSGSFAIVTLAIMVLYVYNGNSLSLKKTALVVIACLIWFALSFLLIGCNGILLEHFLYFLFMGICGLYISQIEINVYKVLLTIAVMSLFLAPFLLSKIPDIRNSEDVGLLMGISYSLVRLLIAIAFLLFFFKKNTKSLFKLIFSLFFFILLVSTLTFCSRGAILALFVSIFLCFLVLPQKHRRLRICIALVLLVFVGINFLTIIEVLFDYFASKGIEIGGLWKILNLAKSDDIDNGREELYSIGWEMFCNSPIIGNGIGSFPIKTGVIYVHNIFIQFLLEGGLVFFVPFLGTLIIALNLLLKPRLNNENKLFLIYLFSCGILPLFFSETFWRAQLFWLFVGYVLKMKRITKFRSDFNIKAVSVQK